MHLSDLYGPGQQLTLTKSGDHAISAVLKALKRNGIATILLQDQGGWLTYKRFAHRLHLKTIELSTTHGVLEPESIPLIDNAALLITSLAGYIAPQPMTVIAEQCTKKHVILINDASGSLGTANARIGDILLGSFGTAKPVNFGYGGFIAAPKTYVFRETFDKEKLPGLQRELAMLEKRRAFLAKHASKIKHDLAHLTIIHRDAPGLNVVVAYANDSEKNEITSYCNKHDYPYTECPRSIRVLTKAISIEVKRLTEPTSFSY